MPRWPRRTRTCSIRQIISFSSASIETVRLSFFLFIVLLSSFAFSFSVVVALSGQAGATLRSFDVLTGQLLLEKCLHPPESGRISDPTDLGVQITFLPTADDSHHPDMFVLTNGHTVRRIAGSNGGEIRWSWEIRGSLLSSPTTRSIENIRCSTQFIISDIIATTTTIYLIGLEKTSKSYTLHLTSLSASTGDEIASTPVSSSISHGLKDVIALRHSNQYNANPIVAWLQQGTLHTHNLTPNLKGKPTSLKGSSYKTFKDIGLTDYGQFIAIKLDESSQAYKLTEDNSGLASFWDFADSAPSKKYTGSLYGCGLDSSGWPYIARIHWSFATRVSS
jgi:ER membrane protein complex subunit 1